MHTRSFLFGFAACLALGGSVAVAQSKSLDDVVLAVVNGDEITRRQLVSRLLEYQGEDALQKMVNRSILLQSARRLNVTVSDEETLKKYEEIKKQFKTDEEFQGFLSKSQISEKQYRDEIRHTLLLQKVALKEGPIVNEDLVQFDVRMIVGPDRTTLEKWVKDLDGGADFRKLASERSTDPAGRQAGGKMRPFLKIELLDVWRSMDDQKVKPGGYTRTPVLLTDNTWAIVKLEGTIPADTVSATEKERLQTMVTSYRMNQWLIQARGQAKISFPTTVSAVVGERK